MSKRKKIQLYLIYFPRENFYKVGLTNIGTLEKFKGFPYHKVIDVHMVYEDEAVGIKRYILTKLAYYQYHPCAKNFKKWHFECFKFKTKFVNRIKVNSLDSLLESIK
jgi:hypothetical protein